MPILYLEHLECLSTHDLDTDEVVVIVDTDGNDCI